MSVLLSARGIGKLYPDAKLRRRKADRWSL
ncbi:MAG: hypothetical protein JWO88_3066, partial [Frankiales bacterium]|nr:hypothetical protein [Frankiales bacterium]